MYHFQASQWGPQTFRHLNSLRSTMSSTTEAQVHVIDKSNNTIHTTLTVSETQLPNLSSNSIRVRPALISLTANNLTYARFGSAYGWWAAFPIPSNLPAPYNDSSRFGTVPVWGYGEIVESKVEALKPGQLIWGYWPATSLPVVLELEALEPKGHYYDISEHRKALWSIYQRYQVRDSNLRLKDLSQVELEQKAWETIFRPVWECGFDIDQFLFSEQHVHPLGKNGGVWTAEDADLSQAVVISLSASGKTARSYNDSCLNNRKPEAGPLGFVAVTSKVDGSLLTSKTTTSTRTVAYAESSSNETLSFISSKQPSKIVIVDFGGRDNSLSTLLSTLSSHPQLSPAKTLIIGCGGEPKVTTSAEDLGKYLATLRVPGKIQMNTSDVREAAIGKLGAASYFEVLEEGWKGFVERENMKGLKLELRNGVEAFEAGWTKLCEGRGAEVDGMAFRLDQ